MADSESIITLNIGSQKISMAEILPSKGGITLKSYNTTSILADPAAEAARVPQVQLAIKELAKSLKIKSKKAAYALSGQSVFIRFVKLPPLDSENVEELVRFEAQQNVPFPLDEVIWDWEKLETGGIETEVVIVAIKSDSLNDLNEVVAETGLGTRLVDASPTALYNALRYNYQDLGQPTLLIDVGAKTTNLVYAEGEKFFTRSVNIGGTVLTSAIAKEYGISFTEAEQMKTTKGLVTLQGGHASQLDEQTAALGTVIRNTLNRLPAEIQRTTTLFRTQQGGGAPQRVILAGGGANLPYMKEFLEEKLKLPVEFFNPLQPVGIGKGLDPAALQGEALQMGEIIGLGLRGADKALIDIDLVPDKVQAEREINKRKPILILASVLFLSGIAAWAFFQSITASKAEAYLNGELEEESSRIQKPAAQLKTLLSKEKEAIALSDAYLEAENARMNYVRLYNDIAGNIASEQIWLVDIEPRYGFSSTPEDSSRSAIEDGFARTAYGKSPFAVKADQNVKADAVLIRGLWRDNTQDVYNALKALRENSEFLAFEAEVPAGRGKFKTEKLDDSFIIKTLAGAPQEGDFAASFELLIPLKEPIAFK